MPDLFAVDVPRFRSANEERTRAAAERDVARARAVLDSGAVLRPVDRTVLAARVEHPLLSLAALGGLLGVSKDTYRRRLSTALKNHERTRT